MPDSIRLIRNASVAIERTLKEKGAVGKGMGDMSGDLEQRGIITPDQGAEIRKLAGFRNRVMHDDYEPSKDETERFMNRSKSILTQMSPKTRRGARNWSPFFTAVARWSFQAVIGFGFLYLLASWNAGFIVKLITPYFLLYLAFGVLALFVLLFRTLLSRQLR